MRPLGNLSAAGPTNTSPPARRRRWRAAASGLVLALAVLALGVSALAPAGSGGLPPSPDSRNLPALHATTALEAAAEALDHSATFSDAAATAAIAPLVEIQRRNLDTALRLNAAAATSPASGITLAKIGNEMQRQTLETGPTSRGAALGHASPSTAVLEILATHGAVPAPLDVSRVLALDDLPSGARASLLRVLDAYLALEHVPSVGLPEFFDARADLLDAVAQLREDLVPTGSTAACNPLQIAPIISIDLTACDNTYVDDFGLLIDAAGDDVYRNNAGGNVVRTAGDMDPCFLVRLDSPAVSARTTAVLLDFAGDDTYGDVAAPRSCGVNGGAHAVGSGLLYDGAGDDVYVGRDRGINGGARAEDGLAAAGLLVDDGGGDDTYTAGSHGVNGGALGALVATQSGFGLLVDAGGADNYTLSSAAFASIAGNGGGVGGHGALIDANGDDVYVAGHSSVNGGGDKGFGFLWDGSGDDTYVGGDRGSNGGAWAKATGFLYDGAGDDTYSAGSLGTNGGAGSPLLVLGSQGGVGVLIDNAGDDQYAAAGRGANGGANGPATVGILVDHAGDDTYSVGGFGANGGAVAFNVDAAPGALLAHAWLRDLAGDDTYVAGDHGTNGGGSTGGSGHLIDESGDDSYTAGSWGTNGGGNYFGFGLLWDRAGTDTYYDEGTHSCPGTDRSCIPKGFVGSVGAQVDEPVA